MVKSGISCLGFRVQQRIGKQRNIGTSAFYLQNINFWQTQMAIWPKPVRTRKIGIWYGLMICPCQLVILNKCLTNPIVVEHGNTTSGWNWLIGSNFAHKKPVVQWTKHSFPSMLGSSMFLCHQARTFSRTVSRRLCLVQAREASESILIQELIFWLDRSQNPRSSSNNQSSFRPIGCNKKGEIFGSCCWSTTNLLIVDPLQNPFFLLFNSLLLLVELMKPHFCWLNPRLCLLNPPMLIGWILLSAGKIPMCAG